MKPGTPGITTAMERYGRLRRGEMSRRAFIRQSLAAGMALPVALQAVQAASAQTPQAGPPVVGLEGTTRGEGGELRILQWQAPTILAQHTALGGKDNLAATLVLEPLTHYLGDGTLIPNLVEAVPTVENGLLAADSSSVTYQLKPGVTWSDGAPLTADDVSFTWSWIADPANGASSFDIYGEIATVDVVDELTVTIRFNAPQPAWYVPFSGSWWGAVYPKHILEGAGADGYAAFLLNPVGTGPYVVESFAPNDQAVYAVNQTYRDPDRPFFDRVILKGGGDAASAARAVLQTGDYDFAWNLQVEPEVLDQLSSSGNGSILAVPGASLEQIYLNFSDPTVEIDGEFAALAAPHPFLTELPVRQALAQAIDREMIATVLYGEGEPASANVLVGIPRLESDGAGLPYDLDAANRLLDEAGWARDGDVRSRDGVRLSVTYATTINSVRQKTQAIVKQALEDIGVEVVLEQVDSGTYFDTSPGNTQGYIQFYDDLGMSTATIDSPFPLKYMSRWYAGPDNANVAQRANDWSGQNLQRYVNPEFDALYEQAETETDPDASAQLFIAMNDLLVVEQVVIPLVQRAAEKVAVGPRLRQDNIDGGSFETVYWNIANWTTNDA